MTKIKQRGFSLIELMIVVAIIGILAAIAAPNFMDYMRKTKKAEVLLQLNKLAKNAKVEYSSDSRFPQGTAAVLPGADGANCASGMKGLFPVVTWTSDPVWQALNFQIDEPVRFSYHYTSASPSVAQGLAVGDLDCDTVKVTYTLDLTVPDGNATAVITEPPANSD
ncbi:MAG: prepilin-type N-terminal cleavage/methylation domain-containing protein [Kofleriaceae bacterium]